MSIAIRPPQLPSDAAARCLECGTVESDGDAAARTFTSRVLPVVADEEPIVLWFLCPRCLGMKETQP